MSKNIVGALAFCGCALLAAAPDAATPSNYRLVPLGHLPGGEKIGSWGKGLNERGQVVGYSKADHGGTLHVEGFRWAFAGGMQGLGFLSPKPIPYYAASYARLINERNQVLGDSGGETFLWDSFQGMKGLGKELAGVTYSACNPGGFNNAGTIVGICQGVGFHAYVWTRAQGMLPIDDIPDSGKSGTWATRINDVGQFLAGNMGYENFRRESDGAYTPIIATGSCVPTDMNAGGAVLLLCYSAKSPAYLWTPAGARAISILDGGLNDLGQIVGISYDPDPFVPREPVLVEPDSTVYRLRDLLENGAGWELKWAKDINNLGQIVGMAVNPEGIYEAVLLEPATIKRLTVESIGAADGWILESAPGSGRGGTVNAGSSTLRVGDDEQNRQYRSVLSFDTSGIPENAEIFAVTVRVRQQGVAGVNPIRTHGRLLAQIRSGHFGGGPGLGKGDFQAAASPVANGQVERLANSGWRLASLEPSAFPFVNRAGITQFRLRFFGAYDGDGVADIVSFFSGNASAHRPTLTVEYRLP